MGCAILKTMAIYCTMVPNALHVCTAMLGSADALLLVLDAEHLLSCQSLSSQESIRVCWGLLIV